MHRFEWLYVTVFVSPASGESFWYLSDGVSKALFEKTLALFAREAGAGRGRIIVLVLDNAGWHSEPNLAVPEGVRLVYLPPPRIKSGAGYTRPNCSPPKPSGPWSTSRSSTSTSRPSPSSTPPSPNAASPSTRIETW